ncbi:4403_t:CDS:1, partial [Racocetra fulgida]
PWLYSELTQEQYQNLFYLSSEMTNEINQELYKYLQIIIDELINNLIIKLMKNSEQVGFIKKCLNCQTSNINNKKQLCPNCNTKLPTISKAKQLNEPLEVANIAKKSL